MIQFIKRNEVQIVLTFIGVAFVAVLILLDLIGILVIQ